MLWELFLQPASFEIEAEGISGPSGDDEGRRLCRQPDRPCRGSSTPHIGPGEILIRVEACGICHTDLKKIEYDLLPGPRIYGHETAGVVVAVGEGVRDFRLGDRVVAFHHIPCRSCFYCDRKLYAQCPVYKKVGITAGFEAAGGGFAQYVRVMDWIVANGGVEKIPDGVTFEVASLVEPVNTVHKAVVQANPQPGDLCVVLGQGPIGLMFTSLAAASRSARGCHRHDAIPNGTQPRVRVALEVYNPLETPDLESRIRSMTVRSRRGPGFRGSFRSGNCRPGVSTFAAWARILLFSQTSAKERIDVSGADICVGERMLFGCYSASVDLQKESAQTGF